MPDPVWRIGMMSAPEIPARMPTRAVGPEPPAPVRKILLATDLSPTSGPATDEAFEVAHRLGAHLLVVSVIDSTTLRLPGGLYQARVDQVRERRQSAAQELVQRGRREGIRVTFLVWEGDPGDSILEAARAEDADMVILGSHGRGPIGRLLLGSVSQHVVRHARVPVVVVPRDADAGPD
jgi:nucleotide-binding universal stress UspA family protein